MRIFGILLAHALCMASPSFGAHCGPNSPCPTHLSPLSAGMAFQTTARALSPCLSPPISSRQIPERSSGESDSSVSILDRAEEAAARQEKEIAENSSIHDFAISSSSSGTPLAPAEGIQVGFDLPDGANGDQTSSTNPLGKLGFVKQVVATRARKLLTLGFAVSIKAASALRPVERCKELVARGKDRLDPMLSKVADAGKAKAGQGARWISAEFNRTRDALAPLCSRIAASAGSALGPAVEAREEMCRRVAAACEQHKVQQNLQSLRDRMADAGAKIREELGPICSDLAASGKEKLDVALHLADAGRAKAGQGVMWMCSELNRTREALAPTCCELAATGKDRICELAATGKGKLCMALHSARRSTAGAFARAKARLDGVSGQGKGVIVASLCGAALGVAAKSGTLSLRAHPSDVEEDEEDDFHGAWPWSNRVHLSAHMDRIFKLMFLSYVFCPV
jgi:hypothetical protein